MNITLNNYEEYFLLLGDNELSPAEEALVRQFAAQHPHLQEELQLLLSCRLDAADMPAFPKEKLLRPTVWNVENPVLIQTQMLSLIDNELPAIEKEKLQKQIAGNPVLQAEWNVLEKAVLPIEIIAYPDKTTLYRQHKVRPLVWVRWAAAAAVISLTWLLWPAQNKTGLSSGTMAIIPAVKQSNPVPAQPNISNVKSVNGVQPATYNTATSDAAVAKQYVPKAAQAQTKMQATTTKSITVKKDAEPVLVKQETVAPAPQEINVADPTNTTLGSSNSIEATLATDENITVQTAQLTPKTTTLLPNALQSAVAANAEEVDEHDGYVQIAGAKFDKHKVRGLFRGITRSVTRSFNKSKIQPVETASFTRNL